MKDIKMKEESSGMCMDDVELALRRFAAEQKDSALMSLIQSMFKESAMQKVKHETSTKDVKEDSTEKE